MRLLLRVFSGSLAYISKKLYLCKRRFQLNKIFVCKLGVHIRAECAESEECINKNLHSYLHKGAVKTLDRNLPLRYERYEGNMAGF